MGVVIKRYLPGDLGVWPLIGPFLTSREVHKSLGGPVVSEPEATTWWVATNGKAVVGFCALRDDGAYWLENSYVVPDARGEGVHTKLSDARLKHLETLPPKTVRVCCRTARWPYYEAQGFHQDRIKGDWIYASRVSAPAKVKA